MRHEDGRPRNADRKAKVKINAEIDRPATVETSALLHSKADDAADEER